METKIVLTELEEKMLIRHLDGEFFPPDQTEEEIGAMASVTEKADALMEELDAYDELGDNLMAWFYAKYQAQKNEQAATE